MHINMKYYIVSIGAIFIALGIGMLVGFNLNYDQELSKQQANIISDLDNKFEDLKTTNDNLEKSLSTLTADYDKAVELINKNKDKIIADTLSEKNIGIISTNENNDYSTEISDIITKANGSVAFNIVLNNNVENKEKLQEVSTKLNLELKSSKDLVKYISECLASQEGLSKLQELQSLEVIKVNSISDEFSNCESVILAGGNESKVDDKKFKEVDGILIASLKEQNKSLVGVQQTNAKFSYVDMYSKNKVANIDNVDEGIGQVSLVILLNDKGITGNFGRLETASTLFPEKK
ncbi:copper transporter [Romboutsia lituseburensis]|uniref:copper transporter n=1 Tax=Romboutsia lituseburensis TaxID=1537 RepID=UPI00215AAEB0|nr:copper transporter [Romboutsia lituseburensis]MCR8745224.1 copper transporter [Romboutsia lituseburensis]